MNMQDAFRVAQLEGQVLLAKLYNNPRLQPSARSSRLPQRPRPLHPPCHPGRTAQLSYLHMIV
jgi:hypothetical protein